MALCLACEHKGLGKGRDAGLPATGGTSAWDASPGTGGMTDTGGTIGTGGVPDTGGVIGTGGVPDTGGVIGTGGTVSDLCTASSQCTAPLVCNLNTNMKCGPAVYTQVEVSDLHTCAAVSDGSLRCWGDNSQGQLGVASTVNRLTPAAVLGVSRVKRVATGYRHTCVLLWDGEVRCWGYNINGSLGCSTPVMTEVGPACTPYPAGSPVERIIAGGESTCALLADGTVQCWGRNNHYQVGDGTNATAFRPMTAAGVTGAIGFATGVWQTCAVLADGTCRCWGANNRGQLGNSTSSESPIPTLVSGIDGITSSALMTAVGEGHSCFGLADGSVRCSGDDDYGQLGDDSTVRKFSPVLSTVIPPRPRFIAVGLGFTCFAGDDGRLQCLGAGASGQLGNGASVASRTPTRVDLPGDATIASMAARYNHACAVATDGRLWCWGGNPSGQLGNGTQVASNLPVEVAPPN